MEIETRTTVMVVLTVVLAIATRLSHVTLHELGQLSSSLSSLSQDQLRGDHGERSPYMYNSAAAIVAYTSEWKEESIPQRQQNKERMLRTGIIVEEVKYRDFVKKLFAP